MTPYFKISRQAFYKSEKSEISKSMSKKVALDMALQERQIQPELGTKKLYRMLRADLQTLPSKLSRDRFFDLMRENNMLIHRKRRFTHTTNSDHQNNIYPNLLKDINKVEKAAHILISDMTYIRVGRGFCYLSLTADLFSRKILGFSISNDLSSKWPFQALKQALRSIPSLDKKTIIHHSDRGIQYSSNLFTRELKRNDISISMSAKGNPYDNAVMERINGILKQEYYLGGYFRDIKELTKSVVQAIRIYNDRRPHLSLNYKTPSEVFIKNCEKLAS